jgi:hypothetical protein
MRLSWIPCVILFFLAFFWVDVGLIVYFALRVGSRSGVWSGAASAPLFAIIATGYLGRMFRNYGPPGPNQPHYLKHRHEFGGPSFVSARAYTKAAQRLFRSRGPYRQERPNGDVAVFDQRTSQFAVFTPAARLRTYFVARRPGDLQPTLRRMLLGPPADYWLPLSPSEAVTLQSYFASHGRRPGRAGPRTIDALLDEWKTVLNEIWYGYSYSEDDYTNDLVLRDMIEDIIELLGNESSAVFRAKIDRWDDGFEQVTQVTNRPLYYLFGTVLDVAKPGRWWWDRAPLVVDPAQGWGLGILANPASGPSDSSSASNSTHDTAVREWPTERAGSESKPPAQAEW